MQTEATAAGAAPRGEERIENLAERRLGDTLAIIRIVQFDPLSEIKIGHDQKQDVLRKMGPPYRAFVDSRGHEVLTYVWANGKGAGRKYLIALNENDVVYLIEVAP